MRELSSPFWIKLKGALFLVMGLMASALLFEERPTLRVALLLMIAIWSFCRLYYFAFYVLQNYVDPSFRFSGVIAMFRCFVSQPR
jgi:hypothetical protein